ncbi:MAG TPA: lysophospholipid acyltransferase family protein [Candidatus Binatia bacterium]|jgi:KDO2-lipid IV(A) lauroyltransferase
MSRVRETLAYIALVIGIESGRLLVRLMPRKLLLGLFEACAYLTYRLFGRYRERSVRNVETAFGAHPPGGSAAIVRGSLRNFFRAFAELALALAGGVEWVRREIPARGLEHLEAALAKNKGVIVLSAHLGNFLLLGSRLTAAGYPVYTLINQRRGGKLSELRKRYRVGIGQRTIHAYPRDEAFREVVHVLRENESVVVIADEFRSRSGIEVPFFGRPVVARRGPATLALRTGAAVVPASLVRRVDGGLELAVEPEIDFARTGKIKSDVVDATLKITQWLEKTVRAHPDQWNWMPLRWLETEEKNSINRQEEETR